MQVTNTTSTPGSSPIRRVSARFIFVYALAQIGVWMALLTPPVMTLALRVAELDPVNKEANLSWIMAVGAVVAMLTNPIAGLLSDRTTSRFGMRRPWLVGGVLVGSAGLYLVATGSMTGVLIGWCIAQLGFNALLAAIIAILPDQVPPEQRGTVGGVMGICLQLGIVGGIALTQFAGGSMLRMFMLPAAIAAVAVLLLVLQFEDRRLVAPPVQRLGLLAFFKGFWIDPRRAPDFAWAFLSRFLLFIGLATLLTYQVFFLIDKLHIAPADIPQRMFISTLVTTVTTVVASLLSGYLSDKLDRRKPFVLLAALAYAAGLAVIGTASSFDQFLVGIGICGLGQGAYLAVDLALVTAVLPNQEADAAKDMGVFNLASALPQSIAPALAPIFLAIGASGASGGSGNGSGNYAALFIAAAIFGALGAVAVLPIRRSR